jgi:hypothetical protein
MLTQSDKDNLVRDFPNIKLSYENIVYKKVYKPDYIVAAPEGTRCFAWFTALNEKMVCLLMELTPTNQISDVKLAPTCFSNDLAYGTILYGTVVTKSQSRFFYIEDIFSYKGSMVDRICWGEKLATIRDMLKKDLRQVLYNNSFVAFGLPLMCKTNEELAQRAGTLPYTISVVQFKLFNRTNNYLFMPYKNYVADRGHKASLPKPSPPILSVPIPVPPTLQVPVPVPVPVSIPQQVKQQQAPVNRPTNRESVFLVKADIQNDIYNLYSLAPDQTEEQHSTAHIPDFNTSVMMNKLFRNIKENQNLDALEESDDEEEFENERADKFVYLDRSLKMVCQFNHKFKKWSPIKIADKNSRVIASSEAKNVYKPYDQNRRRCP